MAMMKISKTPHPMKIILLRAPGTGEQTVANLFARAQKVVTEVSVKPDLCQAEGKYEGLEPRAYPAVAVVEESIGFSDVVAEGADMTEEDVGNLIFSICDPSAGSKCSAGGCGSCGGCG